MNVLTEERTWKKTAFLSFKIVIISSFFVNQHEKEKKNSEGSQILSHLLILGCRSQLSTAG